MTVTASEPAATMSVEDNPSEMLARRLRAHLQAFATLRLPITYREAAKGLLLSPPNTIHQVTEALEQLLAEDAAPTAPSSRPWSSASGAAACRHRGSSTVRVGSDASPARLTHGRSRQGAAKLQWRVVRLAEALARENAHFAVVAAPEEEGLRGRCHPGSAGTQRLQDQSERRVYAKTQSKVDEHPRFRVTMQTPRRCAPMGGSFAPGRVAGFRWNGWQTSAVYA